MTHEEWKYKGHEVEYDSGNLWIDGDLISPTDIGTMFYTKDAVRDYIDEHLEDDAAQESGPRPVSEYPTA